MYVNEPVTFSSERSLLVSSKSAGFSAFAHSPLYMIEVSLSSTHRIAVKQETFIKSLGVSALGDEMGSRHDQGGT